MTDKAEKLPQMVGKGIDEADDSLLIMAPRIDDDLVDHLFRIVDPLRVRLVVPREVVEDLPRETRHHLQQVMDVNPNVSVRIVDPHLPPWVSLDKTQSPGAGDEEKQVLRERLEGATSVLGRLIWDQADEWSVD